MNVPFARRIPLPPTRHATERTEEASVCSLAPSLSAIIFERPAGRRERMEALQDGAPLPRPFIAAELGLRNGGTRHVILVPQAVDSVLSRPLKLRVNGTIVAEIDPTWLQLPREELPALTSQLTEFGVSRLLRLMLTTGASLFSADAQAGLATALPRIMDICRTAALTPVARCQIAGRGIVSFHAPGLADLTRSTDSVAIHDGRLIRLKELDHRAEGDLLHVLLPPGRPPEEIVVFVDRPMRLATAEGTLPATPARAWLRQRDDACRGWILRRLGLTDAVAPEAGPASTLGEARLTVRHLSSVSDGILHALTLEDPARCVAGLVVRLEDHQLQLPVEHGPDGIARITGLLDLPETPRPQAICRLHLLDHAGRSRMMVEQPLAAFDGQIPAGFDEAWLRGADVTLPLARARARCLRARPPVSVERFGTVKSTALRIVTAIEGPADLIRARAAMVMTEKPDAPVEIICTMADGPLTPGARMALSDCAAIYGVPHRLVLLPGSAHPGERLHAALGEARDAPALLLGADILPDAPGWLAYWLRRLRRHEALAPALLAVDGAIAAVHEGDDVWCGLPATQLPASGRHVDRPLASCLALSPAGISRLLDAAHVHVEPAIWIAAALRGGARSDTRFPFRRFGAARPHGGLSAALFESEFALLKEDCQ